MKYRKYLLILVIIIIAFAGFLLVEPVKADDIWTSTQANFIADNYVWYPYCNYFKINISEVPSGKNINYARFYMYSTYYAAPPSNIDWWRLTSQSYTEVDSAATMNAYGIDTYIQTGRPWTAISQWQYVDLTNIFKADYDVANTYMIFKMRGNDSSSCGIDLGGGANEKFGLGELNRMEFYDRTNASYYPYLKVSYGAVPIITNVSDTPDPQVSGSSITFNSTASDADPGDTIKLYLCKDSSCTNCGPSGTSNCWAFSSVGSATNPSASYICSSCDYSTNNYYTKVCDNDDVCSSITSVQTFTCKKEDTCDCVSDWSWYNDSWSYRRAISIDNTGGGALTDYQVSVDTNSALYNESGLVGSWHMNESSGTNVPDTSGNNNHGTMTDMDPATDWVSGKYSSGLSFDGVNDHVDLPNDLGYSNQVSAFAWFKSQGTPAGGYHIIFGGQELEISIPSATGEIRTGVYTTARYVSNHGSGLLDGNWHYVGFTFDGSTKKSYIDGEFVGEQTGIIGALTYSFANRMLGRYGSSVIYYANALIDEARIYNRALSEDEVLAHFNASKVRLDYGDVRFTDSDGTTELNYWMEQDGTFWTKVPSISASSQKTIYMYYGNSSETSQSNGSNTFDLFDDFESYTIGDLNGQGGWVSSGGEVVSSPVKYGSKGLRVDNWDEYYYHDFTSMASGEAEFYIRRDNYISWNYYYLFLREGGSTRIFTSMVHTACCGDFRYAPNGQGYPWTQLPTDTPWTNAVWHKVKIRWYSNNTFDIWVDDNLKGSGLDFYADMTTGIDRIYMRQDGSGGTSPSTMYGDSVRVRKYASPEPTTFAEGEVSAIGDDCYGGYCCDAQCQSSDCNQPPAISSVGDTPDPLQAGNDVGFEVSWSDPDAGDQTKIHICKTDAITTQTCDGGSWCDTTEWSVSSPTSCDYTTQAGDIGIKNYYAFIADDSDEVSTSTAGTFEVIANTGPTISSVTDAPDPIPANADILFTVNWVDSGDQTKIHICKTDAITGQICDGGSWCDSSVFSTSSPSTCTYTAQLADLGIQNYYAFVCDSVNNHSVSEAGTFEVVRLNESNSLTLATTTSSGFLISSVFDSGVNGGASFHSLLWQGTLCSSCLVKFQLASSNSSSGPWTYYGPISTSDYYSPNPGIAATLPRNGDAAHQNKRYIRYKVYLEPYSSQSPKVDDIIINWSP